MRSLRSVRLGIAIATSLAVHPVVLAGPYADDMAKCLVKSTTAEDKSTLVQWMFATMSLHPDVKWMAALTADQRETLNKNTAKLFETLLTKTCLAETKQALQYEGPSTIESSFSVLGQVAARELFANPAVAAGNADLAKYLNTEAIQNLVAPPKPQ